MRPSGFIVVCSACVAASACATSESIDVVGGALGSDANSPLGGDGSAPESGAPFDETGGFVGAGGFGTGGVVPGSGGRVIAGSGGNQTIGTGGRNTGAGGVTSASGGTLSGSGGFSGSGGCKSTEKVCGGVCVTPNASVGCDLSSCTACPAAPTNGFVKCTGTSCDFDCLSGFTKSGNTCTSGGGGGGGTGGGGGACNASSCPSCFISGLLGTACCKSDGSCGCKALLGLLPCG